MCLAQIHNAVMPVRLEPAVIGRNFPPVSFFPGERMGRPILSPGKKLTGEKTDRYTATPSVSSRALYHWATALLEVKLKHFFITGIIPMNKGTALKFHFISDCCPCSCDHRPWPGVPHSWGCNTASEQTRLRRWQCCSIGQQSSV